jgi:hypothetical protein
MRQIKAVLAVGVTSLIWASVAAAQQPYLGSGGGVQGEVGGGGDVAGTSGALPFTGFDLGALLVGGVLLLILGFVLRRNTRPRSKALG